MEQQTKNCPYCGEEILAVAKKCKHCGEWLETKEGDAAVASAEPAQKAEAPLANQQQEIEKTKNEVAPVETYYESTTKKLFGEQLPLSL